MNKRLTALVSTIALSVVSGCTTISFIPPVKTLTTSVSISVHPAKSQADAFVDFARKNGWASAPKTLSDLIAVLVSGHDEFSRQQTESDEKPSTTTVPRKSINLSLQSASDALSTLCTLAGDEDTPPTRRALISIDRALVAAYASERTFRRRIAEEAREIDLKSLEAAIACVRDEADRWSTSLIADKSTASLAPPVLQSGS